MTMQGKKKKYKERLFFFFFKQNKAHVHRYIHFYYVR